MRSMPPIAVLAGGLATRMGEATRRIPKSMLEVAGQPFIAHQLRLFRREGISRVVLCVGHLFEQLRDFVGDGAKFDLEVLYSMDGEKLLGTGGALMKALPLLGPEFLVTYGDSYLDIAYAPIVEAFRVSRKRALMSVLHNRGQWDVSNIMFCDRQILRYSKVPDEEMAYIDFGLSMLAANVFSDMPPDDPFDLAMLFTRLVKEGQMAGYEVSQRFYEIGSHAGRAQTSAYIMEHYP